MEIVKIYQHKYSFDAHIYYLTEFVLKNTFRNSE
jgi:hypothetical protein